MCTLVVPEIRHAAAQLGSLGFVNVKFNDDWIAFFTTLLQKLISVVSRFIGFRR
jgi:hypothetical protein